MMATMAALMVWSRFSASSKTIEAGDSKTSSVTSRASRWYSSSRLAAELGVGVVQGRQAVHELRCRVPGRLHGGGVDLVGAGAASIRSFQSEAGSPIDTQTSV